MDQEWFEAHGTEAELIHGDVRRIPFGDESFDVIISTVSTHGMPRRRWGVLWASRTKTSQPVKRCRGSARR